MEAHQKERSKPFTILKSVGPKLVPFFKTLTIYLVLFGDCARLENVFYCFVKCLPVISLMVFVLLHGMSLSDCHSYSRKILAGLVFSCIGDAFLVWASAGYFVHGIGSFAVAQILYASAFGLRPLCLHHGALWMLIAAQLYGFLYSGLDGVMTYLVLVYVLLVWLMLWRAVARVDFASDLRTWTKLCAAVGAVCFTISDFTIAVNVFLYRVPCAHQIVMLTYYAAQLGISLSVVDCRLDELVENQM